jgi:hypothetical protein
MKRWTQYFFFLRYCLNLSFVDHMYLGLYCLQETLLQIEAK